MNHKLDDPVKLAKFKAIATAIMLKTTPENCVEKAQEMYKLKRKYFKWFSLKDIDLENFIADNYCPLCAVNRDSDYDCRCNECPLGKSPCCLEWENLLDSMDSRDRPKFFYWFSKLYCKIMELPIIASCPKV